MIDAKAFGEELASIVKAATLPIIERLDEFEKRLASLPEPKDGKDADEAAIIASVTEKMAAELDAIREAVANLPKPELPDVSGMVAEAVAALPLPQDGKSVTVEDVAPLIEEAVAKAVGSLPTPQDGKPGRDGVDVKDLFRAEGGRLIAVLSDGTTKDLGVFVGKDGEDGEPGRDGLGFDDMRLEARSEGVYMVWERGDVIKDAFVPMPFYRGVWSKEAGYREGNTVTWGGSTWIAVKDSPQGKPDAPDSDWMLSNKRGRDGKDAKGN